jgi:hypothetical protein
MKTTIGFDPFISKIIFLIFFFSALMVIAYVTRRAGDKSIYSLKKFAMISIRVCLLLIVSFSCQREEKILPTKGNATFSFDQKDRTNGRIQETTTPAFVLLEIIDGNGNKLEEKKLNLLPFGQSYLSENLELPIGSYQLTQFVVLDASGVAIYATPLEGSELAKYVNDPLPIKFTITNEGTQVTSQVLAIDPGDNPEVFGYASFGFEIISQIGKVKKIVFHDLFADEDDVTDVTTMYFQYRYGKVETIKWDFNCPSGGIRRSYSEERFYSADGNLDSLAGGRFNGGSWNFSYEYMNGLRYKTESNRNGTISTTTFWYNDAKPILVENLYGIYGILEGLAYPNSTAFKFDTNGNLIAQKNIDIPGFPDAVQEKTTTYNTELNPLRNLIETPLPQVIEYYDDLAFYFSTNLPSFVESNYPYVDPLHNRITFEYDKDNQGRVVRVKALRPDLHTLRYTLDITYY